MDFSDQIVKTETEDTHKQIFAVNLNLSLELSTEYKVISVKTLDEALEFFDTSQIDLNMKTIMISDWQVPPYTALTLKRELWARNIHIPAILVLTGHCSFKDRFEREIRENRLGRPFLIILRKPTLDKLLDAIKRIA